MTTAPDSEMESLVNATLLLDRLCAKNLDDEASCLHLIGEISADHLDMPESKDKNSLLHLAIINGYEKTALALIAKGATPDLRNKKDETPLMLAVGEILPDIVAALVEKGADIDAVNSGDNSPRFIGKIVGLTLEKSLKDCEALPPSDGKDVFVKRIKDLMDKTGQIEEIFKNADWYKTHVWNMDDVSLKGEIPVSGKLTIKHKKGSPS